MTRPDGRIEPGQPLRGAISARAWNRAQDAADIVFGNRYSVSGESGGGGLKPYTWVYCKPSITVQRWGILEITGVEITPTSSDSSTATRSFEDCPVITGGSPSSTTTAWCVAVEPIESGKVGRVAVAGLVQCKVSDLGDARGAHILWKDSHWSLIRMQAGVIRGTFSGTWEKGDTATVTDSVVSGAEYYAHNYIATVSSSTCLIAHVSGEWVLVGWDWHAMPSYDATKQQVLSHAADGGLGWLNTTACT